MRLDGIIQLIAAVAQDALKLVIIWQYLVIECRVQVYTGGIRAAVS